MTNAAYEMMEIAAKQMVADGIDGPLVMVVNPEQSKQWRINNGDIFWMGQLGFEIEIVVTNIQNGKAAQMRPACPFGGLEIEPKRLYH